MQQPVPPISSYLTKVYTFATIVFGVGLVLLTGCSGPTTTRSAEQPKQFASVSLTVRCPDAAFAEAIEPMVRVWAARTGATVAFKREPMTTTDDTDVGVIPVGGLGEWADAGLIVPLPHRLQASDNPFQWSTLLLPYQRLASWGEQTQAVPLAGDGFVIVYRADRLNEKTAELNKPDRSLAPPTTWEDFAEVAAFFAARDGKPSLPPLPSDPDRLFDLFSRIASCFGREAKGDSPAAQKGTAPKDPGDGAVDVLAFHHLVSNGKPRLNTAGFLETANWFADLHAKKCFPPDGTPDDPVAALAEGRAVIAVLSLDQLARLPRENGVVPPRFALARLPGSRKVHRQNGTVFEGDRPNYVPHFAGGRLGVVRTRCQHQDAAFDLLAELGGPARSAELISTPGLGAGPFRVA